MCSFAGGPPFFVSRSDKSDILSGVLCERLTGTQKNTLADRALRYLERLVGREL